MADSNFASDEYLPFIIGILPPSANVTSNYTKRLEITQGFNNETSGLIVMKIVKASQLRSSLMGLIRELDKGELSPRIAQHQLIHLAKSICGRVNKQAAGHVPGVHNYTAVLEFRIEVYPSKEERFQIWLESAEDLETLLFKIRGKASDCGFEFRKGPHYEPLSVWVASQWLDGTPLGIPNITSLRTSFGYFMLYINKKPPFTWEERDMIQEFITQKRY